MFRTEIERTNNKHQISNKFQLPSTKSQIKFKIQLVKIELW